MARQYYREKFKPTKGAFGGTSKYNRRLKEQAKLKAQIAEMEEKKKQAEAEKAEKAEKPAPKKPAPKKPAPKKTATKKTKQENAGDSTE